MNTEHRTLNILAADPDCCPFLLGENPAATECPS